MCMFNVYAVFYVEWARKDITLPIKTTLLFTFSSEKKYFVKNVHSLKRFSEAENMRDHKLLFSNALMALDMHVSTTDHS